jgi:hypothetical protein
MRQHTSAYVSELHVHFGWVAGAVARRPGLLLQGLQVLQVSPENCLMGV